MQIFLVSAEAPLGQMFVQMCDGVSEYRCSPAPGSLLVGLFGFPECQGPSRSAVGMEQPPRETVVGTDPTEILGGAKVEVAAAETPEWRQEFGTFVILAVTQPNCCPSQML